MTHTALLEVCGGSIALFVQTDEYVKEFAIAVMQRPNAAYSMARKC